MIEIIKRGTKKKHKCSECGCIFSYEDEDVMCDTVHNFVMFGVAGCAWEYSVQCPQCEEKIILKDYK